jgi:preprotein translocase subunit SecF
MNIIGRMKIWFAISILTIIIGVGSLFIYRLQPSIDFTGGSLLEISSKGKIDNKLIKKDLATAGFKNVAITTTGEGNTIIKSKPVDQKLKSAFIENYNKTVGESRGVKEESFQTIGPTVSNDLINKSIYSVILASLGIIAYITFAFRKMPDKGLSWRFGFSAIFALLHDLLFTIGIFAIAADFFHWEVDTLFITALLTVIGFSVHDTIVVFDRIRENSQIVSTKNFDTVVNDSVVQTIARSLNTSLTILITLACLLILGGESIRPFVFTLFIGIFVGTYSSIFIASPIIVIWQRIIDKRSQKRLANV